MTTKNNHNPKVVICHNDTTFGIVNNEDQLRAVGERETLMTDTETQERLPFNLASAGTDAQAPKPAALEVDFERYQSYLDEEDLSEAEKQAFVEALWSIVLNFVDLGFGVHPLQKVCGQIPEMPCASEITGGDGVESPSKPLGQDFDDAAHYLPERAESLEVFDD